MFWDKSGDWRQILRFTVASVLAMSVCIAPWTFRNMRELGAPVLISTNGPANLWMGNNPDANGAYIPLPADVSPLSEVERSKVLGGRARQLTRSDPGRDAELVVRKLVITHDRETIGITWNEASVTSPAAVKILKALSTVYWWLASGLAVYAAVMLPWKGRWHGLLHPALLAWGYFILVHAITVGADRYHFPSIPFIAMLAGYIVTCLMRSERQASRSQSSLLETEAREQQGSRRPLKVGFRVRDHVVDKRGLVAKPKRPIELRRSVCRCRRETSDVGICLLQRDRPRRYNCRSCACKPKRCQCP